MLFSRLVLLATYDASRMNHYTSGAWLTYDTSKPHSILKGSGSPTLLYSVPVASKVSPFEAAHTLHSRCGHASLNTRAHTFKQTFVLTKLIHEYTFRWSRSASTGSTGTEYKRAITNRWSKIAQEFAQAMTWYRAAWKHQQKRACVRMKNSHQSHQWAVRFDSRFFERKRICQRPENQPSNTNAKEENVKVNGIYGFFFKDNSSQKPVSENDMPYMGSYCVWLPIFL